MDVEALIALTLREAGYGPDAVGSALPRIMRILYAEDVLIAVGRSLSRKVREYVRVHLEIGLNEKQGSECTFSSEKWGHFADQVTRACSCWTRVTLGALCNDLSSIRMGHGR